MKGVVGAFNKEKMLVSVGTFQNIVFHEISLTSLHHRHKKWFYSLHVWRVGQSRTRASVRCTVYSTVQYSTVYKGGDQLGQGTPPAASSGTSWC